MGVGHGNKSLDKPGALELVLNVVVDGEMGL